MSEDFTLRAVKSHHVTIVPDGSTYRSTTHPPVPWCHGNLGPSIIHVPELLIKSFDTIFIKEPEGGRPFFSSREIYIHVSKDLTLRAAQSHHVAIVPDGSTYKSTTHPPVPWWHGNLGPSIIQVPELLIKSFDTNFVKSLRRVVRFLAVGRYIFMCRKILPSGRPDLTMSPSSRMVRRTR